MVIEKATNGVDADLPPGPSIPSGSGVTWTYRVLNNGNEVLSNIVAKDKPEGTISCPRTSLGPQESMECTAIKGTAIEGQYSNTATVNGETDDGNIDLEQIAVRDDKIGAISCPETTLLAGASMICEASGTVIEGPYNNLGTVEGQDPIGTPVSSTDTSSYVGVDQCGDIVPSEDLLWPPNHKLETVSLVGTVCDGGAASFAITAITQDEPVNGLADGDTSPDGFINGDGTVDLRRERAGGGNGRVYEISYEAVDISGAICFGSVFVGVPHDQGGGSAPIDDGQNYDSTQP